MLTTGIVISTILFAAALIMIIKKGRAEYTKRMEMKQKAREQAIKPDIVFYLRPVDNTNKEERRLYLQNIGSGKAMNIMINDFHHPIEKEWTFKFENTAGLDPKQEIELDFNFLVSGYEASNKYDQLWMFDPEHDHDFAATVVISCSDMDGKPYDKTITIGENKKPKISRARLIQNMMSHSMKK